MNARAIAVGACVGACVIGAGALGACVPDLEQQIAVIDRPMAIAIIAEPAEARPNATVAYHAVVATPAGEAILPALAWTYCTVPKPPTEDGAVAAACFDDPGVPLMGAGADATGKLPGKGCQLFGPLVGTDGARPRDPDPTGGFYQPLRLGGSIDGIDLAAVGLERLACDLANAPPAAVADYRARYRVNVNPAAPVLTLEDGAPLDGAHVAVGAVRAITATWPAEAAEAYVSYDQASGTILDRREAMRATFHTTGGALASDTLGFAEDELGSAVTDAFTAPAAPGPITIWVVLRDSRGGAAVTRATITVE